MNTINIFGNSVAIVFIIMASISYYTERDLWKVNAMIWSITSMIYMNLYYRIIEIYKKEVDKEE